MQSDKLAPTLTRRLANLHTCTLAYLHTCTLAHLHTRLFSPLARQGAVLFALDNLTNLLDYGFHIYLARALLPGDFAITQTVNSVLLVLITAFAMLQPVVAQLSVKSEQLSVNSEREGVNHHQAVGSGVFRYYFGRSLVIGAALMGMVFVAERPMAAGLNVPITAVRWSGVMLLPVMARPVVAGVLQGQQRFVAFGMTRFVYTIGRFAFGLLLVGWGAGAIGAIAAMPLGSFLAMVAGLAWLGRQAWQRPRTTMPQSFRQGWWLSFSAFLAYVAFMSLQSYDLVWVNRTFEPVIAGQYASAVLLRRILAVWPGALVVIFYPRVVAQVKAGKLPDRLLAQTAVLIAVPTLLLALIYFLFGETIARLTFGANYLLSNTLAGLMGVAMVGYGLAAVWLNMFLASRPWPFVGLLGGTAVLQALLLTFQTTSLTGVTAVFALSGWTLASGGLLLYLFWLRPHLRRLEIRDYPISNP